MTAEMVVECVALGLAIYAGWRGLPRVPNLPWGEVFAVAVLHLQGAPGAALRLSGLGPDADLAGVTGAGVGWADVTGWTERLRAALLRRHSGATVVDLGSGLASRWVAEVPGLRGASVDPGSADGDGKEADLARAERIMAVLPSASDRLILILDPAELPLALRALHCAPGLRDRLVALVSVGGGGGPPDWIANRFDHDQLDTELNRATPYVSVGAVGSSGHLPAFPDPPLPRHGRRTIDPIDLGPVDLDSLPPEHLMRALWVVMAYRLAG